MNWKRNVCRAQQRNINREKKKEMLVIIVVCLKKNILKETKKASKHGASKYNHDHDVIHCSDELNSFVYDKTKKKRRGAYVRANSRTIKYKRFSFKWQNSSHIPLQLWLYSLWFAFRKKKKIYTTKSFLNGIAYRWLHSLCHEILWKSISIACENYKDVFAIQRSPYYCNKRLHFPLYLNENRNNFIAFFSI